MFLDGYMPFLKSKYSAAPLRKSKVAASLKELLDDNEESIPSLSTLREMYGVGKSNPFVGNPFEGNKPDSNRPEQWEVEDFEREMSDQVIGKPTMKPNLGWLSLRDAHDGDEGYESLIVAADSGGRFIMGAVVCMVWKSHPLRPVRGREGVCDFDKMDVYQSNEVVYVRGLRRRGEGGEEAEYLCITRQAGHVNSRPLTYATDRDIRDSSDKRLASDIQAVVGLIQLLQGYYLVVVTEARPVGWIGGRGCHQVWSTEKTVLLPLKAASSSDQQQQQSAAAAAVVGSSTSGSGGSILHQRQLAKDERRLIDLVQDMQASRGYYYCHTYDISQSAQSNLAESLLSRFVWNWTHSEGFRDNPDQR
ncbi:hypothetical protein FOZ63_000354, partial [Perkinsus olseni]